MTNDPTDVPQLQLAFLGVASVFARRDPTATRWGTDVALPRHPDGTPDLKNLFIAAGTLIGYLAGELAEERGTTAEEILSDITARIGQEEDVVREFRREIDDLRDDSA
ncbi:hypothetical protein QSU92_01270 [Microbacterium sp. ET2]|uniref:hypothetical protein n=1 Tax=Microbacterium albipurpureum TaxID=3050384 RepID=UPI00259C7A7D|nr:hypothetical protein [Microbacterium sp. ET2 (Ac-2212)]WJL95885.1 hypothetical protein QSU92_01270 [Microbacterium sp. ET2 (Ac-2212)]